MEKLQFSSIFLNEEYFRDYTYADDAEFLNNLSAINIFIGKNNSGKSRFLRKIFEYGELKFLSPQLDILEVDIMLSEFVEKFERLRNTKYGIFFPESEKLLYTLEPYKYLQKYIDNNPVRNLFKSILKYRPDNFQPDSEPLRALLLAEESYQKYENFFQDKSGVARFQYSSVYIPILRGLRPIHKTSGGNKFDNTDDYHLRTTYDYFGNGLDNHEKKIFTGLDFYESLRNHRDGDSEERGEIKNFQEFLSTTFFNNESVELIPRRGGNDVYVKVGSTEEPVFKLGDGIQAIVILTYPLFFNQNKILKVFIEEPELHLHPGFQRIFVETIKRPEFNKFQYFITTHSNHFLDMTLDSDSISVYTFEKKENKTAKPDFLITNVENDNSEILSLIGVRNSSVFLSNCTIWIEGITDRIYIRKYLALIQADKENKFKEDTHFSFVEYGGNNITHWSFLESEDDQHANINVERLCGKLLLITDNDGAGINPDGTVKQGKEKKHERFQKLKRFLGNRYILLPVREIENLLTEEVVKKNVLTYEKNQSVNVSNIHYSKYKNEPLGQYLNKNVVERKRDYASDSGGINDKVNFAKKAVANIETISDISEDAKKIAESIYDFIRLNNT